jgi:hypothetical protein
MAKPKWSEIQEFGKWLESRGFGTDRDRTRFTKGKDGVCLEFWISECANGSFKSLNAQIQMNFVDTWYRNPVIARTFSFLPCKTLSREFVMMCEQQHRMVELETESFFTKVANLVAEKNNEIKEINRGAKNA